MRKRNRTPELPGYEGAIEPWKINLAISRMKALKLPRDEWDDTLQEIVMAILEFRFNEAKANGAKESTVLCSLINNKLREISRWKEREYRRLERYSAGTPCSLDPETNEPIAPDAVTALQMDMVAVVKTLRPVERKICSRLSRGDTRLAIFRGLGWSRNRFIRAMAIIRRKMELVGIDGWVRS